MKNYFDENNSINATFDSRSAAIEENTAKEQDKRKNSINNSRTIAPRGKTTPATGGLAHKTAQSTPVGLDFLNKKEEIKEKLNGIPPIKMNRQMKKLIERKNYQQNLIFMATRNQQRMLKYIESKSDAQLKHESKLQKIPTKNAMKLVHNIAKNRNKLADSAKY